jgi:hypothetical protein
MGQVCSSSGIVSASQYHEKRGRELEREGERKRERETETEREKVAERISIYTPFFLHYINFNVSRTKWFLKYSKHTCLFSVKCN